MIGRNRQLIISQMQNRIYIITILFCLNITSKGQIHLATDSLIIKEIIINGNFVTSRKVVLRELDFEVNDIIKRDDIEYRKQTSINNLIKTSLFNFVDIEIEELWSHDLIISVNLTERWFIWPNLYLHQTDTNFSEWWRTKDLDKLEYGAGLKINNFRGRGETLLLNYHIGNFVKYELDYHGIYLDAAKKQSLSVLASYSARNVLPWNIEFNQEAILKESYKLLRSTGISIKYMYRKAYFNTHSIEIGYSHFNIADTIYSLNQYYAGLNNRGQSCLNLKYEFTRDTRDSKIYPKTGFLFLAGINKKGLGILTSEYNAVELYTQANMYRKLYKRIYIAAGAWYTSNFSDKYVFSSQPGLGYLLFVRGYEYYVAKGTNFLLFKSLIKYELLPMKVINLNIWPVHNLHQFNRIPIEVYTNIFFDAGFVSDRFDLYRVYGNSLVNKLMYSTGAGIDFVTYYDKVLRFDYSFNALGERGLFIHWKAAIR